MANDHKTGKWLPVIERWLKEDEQRPAKQRHTAKRIYDRLVEEYGDEFTGAEPTVRRAVRQIRGRMKAPEVFVPLAAKPGELPQVDFQVKRRASLDAAFVTEMPAVYQAAQERLKRQDRGYLEFAAILTLNHEFAPDTVEAALAQALAMPEGRLTAGIVRPLILASHRPKPVTVTVPPDIAVKLKAPDLSLYDQLAKAVTSI